MFINLVSIEINEPHGCIGHVKQPWECNGHAKKNKCNDSVMTPQVCNGLVKKNIMTLSKNIAINTSRTLGIAMDTSKRGLH